MQKMGNQIKAGFSLFVLVGLACAADAQTGTTKSATVHLYREAGFWGHGLKASIYVDETFIAKMAGNTVAVIQLPAGEHVLRGVNKMKAIKLDLRPGSDHYVKVVMVEGNSVQFLVETTAEEAKPVISRLKPLDKKYLVQYLRTPRDGNRADEGKR
jgi:cell division protein YceG involved in septum cleavage